MKRTNKRVLIPAPVTQEVDAQTIEEKHDEWDTQPISIPVGFFDRLRLMALENDGV